MENKIKNLHLTIGIFGKGGVGKTAITTRFIRNQFIDYYDPSIGDDYKYLDLNDKKLNLLIIDNAGNEEYYAIISHAVRNSDSIILVYSIDDKDSFQEILLHHERNQRYLDVDDYPKILIGNKSDLFIKRKIKTKQGKELAKKLNCKYIETSAKTGENVYQAFYEAYLLAIQEKQRKKEINKQKKANQNQKKKGKCLLM